MIGHVGSWRIIPNGLVILGILTYSLYTFPYQSFYHGLRSGPNTFVQLHGGLAKFKMVTKDDFMFIFPGEDFDSLDDVISGIPCAPRWMWYIYSTKQGLHILGVLVTITGVIFHKPKPLFVGLLLVTCFFIFDAIWLLFCALWLWAGRCFLQSHGLVALVLGSRIYGPGAMILAQYKIAWPYPFYFGLMQKFMSLLIYYWVWDGIATCLLLSMLDVSILSGLLPYQQEGWPRLERNFKEEGVLGSGLFKRTFEVPAIFKRRHMQATQMDNLENLVQERRGAAASNLELARKNRAKEIEKVNALNINTE